MTVNSNDNIMVVTEKTIAKNLLYMELLMKRVLMRTTLFSLCTLRKSCQESLLILYSGVNKTC